ncbi:hypothetical protein NQS38_13415 [Ralstonia pseudosolanacearum]|uniref:hypothetical protein n=1 Tax=Ralstonia pseudosolanacearum TaxID=1310165 RepID=UPI0021F79509|nr:hypothetical protein [Ralstonia pseudosolanacearum]UYR05911.1 hypothetical protein NQS38_13415 [Ralstonia pseudosolanacearum]
MQEETVHKKGAEAETHHISSILRYPLARIHLDNLTRSDIKEWRDQRLQDVAPSTVNRELNIINAALKVAAHEWDVAICQSVLTSVRRPSNPPGRVRRLSPEEEVALRQAGEETRNPYVVPILDLALNTAMRRGEILGLEWERILHVLGEMHRYWVLCARFLGAECAPVAGAGGGGAAMLCYFKSREQ